MKIRNSKRNNFTFAQHSVFFWLPTQPISLSHFPSLFFSHSLPLSKYMCTWVGQRVQLLVKCSTAQLFRGIEGFELLDGQLVSVEVAELFPAESTGAVLVEFVEES